ncbi:hypothetical protein LCGC14_0461750 [marine sediment metagenome]|uniref:RecA family profile 2 domain-containing protein n=1 Tax=marine sediment metagenome TaxID=412755 RepID=A0A0F9SXT1_9ZZZZ
MAKRQAARALLDCLIQAGTKKYGTERVGLLSDRLAPGFLSSQILTLDDLIGKPGIPMGRITELVGGYSTAKSMVGNHLLVEAQRQGGMAILLDTERAYDAAWFEAFGGDVENLVDYNPETIEECFEMIDDVTKALIDFDKPSVIVIDSVSALQTARERDEGVKTPGEHARILAQEFRRLMGRISRMPVALVLMSQKKDTIGQFGGAFGTIGGHAIEFHAAVRLDMRRIGFIRTGKDKTPIGFNVQITLAKSKVGGSRPFQKIVVPFFFDRGADKLQCALPLALQYGMVERASKGRVKFPGAEKSFYDTKFAEHFTDEMYEELRARVFDPEGADDSSG